MGWDVETIYERLWDMGLGTFFSLEALRFSSIMTNNQTCSMRIP